MMIRWYQSMLFIDMQNKISCLEAGVVNVGKPNKVCEITRT